MSIPIALTTYERPFYFNQAMASLERSSADLYNFAIFDDCSKNKEKVEIINNIDHAIYIDTKNRGTVLTSIRAIEHMYHSCCCEYMVLLQDDILLAKTWLERGIAIFEEIKKKHFRIAYLSLYNRDRKCEEKYYIYKCGHPGLVAWIINRDWWTQYRNIYTLNDYITEFFKGNDNILECPKCKEKWDIHEKGFKCPKCGKKQKTHRIRNVIDYKLSLRIYAMKWNIAKVGKTIVQHVGDKSSMLKGKDMTFCRSKNFIGEKR